jgi:hypothetical protein
MEFVRNLIGAPQEMARVFEKAAHFTGKLKSMMETASTIMAVAFAVRIATSSWCTGFMAGFAVEGVSVLYAKYEAWANARDAERMEFLQRDNAVLEKEISASRASMSEREKAMQELWTQISDTQQATTDRIAAEAQGLQAKLMAQLNALKKQMQQPSTEMLNPSHPAMQAPF